MAGVSAASVRRRLLAAAPLGECGAAPRVMDLSQLLSHDTALFYIGVFVLTFFEGETIVLCAAFAAGQGLIDPWLLILAAGLGSFFGDQLYFWLARRYGVRLLARWPRWRQGIDDALSWLERYDAGFILAFRFIYGVRNISSFALGLSTVPGNRFLRLNFIAAGLWAASFVAVGYFLGHALRAVLGDLVRSFSLTMLAVFLALAGGVWFVHRWQRRRQPRFPLGAKAVAPPP